ncbi:MAG: helix-turn-helix domain-containing protein [Micromonosporaceae bacterium]
MSINRGPTLRAQWLGEQLRMLRDAAGLNLREVGGYLRRDASTISRFETGTYPPRMEDVEALLNFYQVTDAKRRQVLERLTRDVWQKGWWDGYSGEVFKSMIDYAWLESRAEEIRAFQPIVVPGLLQTRGYAEAVMRAADPDQPDSQIERWLELRLLRQHVVTTAKTQLSVILDEAVLRRPVGDAGVMAEQLDRLAEAAQRSNVALRVLPAEAGAHASPDGAFKVFVMPEPFPVLVCIETPAGAIYVEHDGVDPFAARYRLLEKISLGPEKSVALVSAAAEQMRRSRRR